MIMGDLIALLFLARDLSHRAHLKTRSYAQHMALGSFYEEIVEVADSLAEAYQGQFAQLLDIPLLEGDTSAPIANVLREHLEWLAANRYVVCSSEQTSLQNLIDEAVALYQSTLYKLEFLA